MVKPSISTLVAGLSLFANAVPAVAGGAPEKGAVFKLDLPPGAATAHMAAESAKFRREVQLQNMRYLQAQAEVARSAAPPGQQ